MAEEAGGKEKKVTAYNYFASSIGHSVPAAKPKLLSEAEIEEQQKQIEQQRQGSGASAWNAAGTFEERSWTESGKEFLSKALVGSKTGPITINELKEVKGEANTWIVRGKRRHGFDFEISLAWSMSEKGHDFSGNASFPNAASDELDELHCELLGSNNEAHNLEAGVAKRVRESLTQQMSKVLSELLADIQKK